MDKQILDEHSQIFLDNYTQKYQGLFLHPEAGRDSKLNESLNDIKEDMDRINDMLKNTGNAINDLLTNTVNRLNLVKDTILAEKERYQDIQMLCNKYTDFDNVKTLDDITFTGTFTEENGTYYAGLKTTHNVAIKILDVYGNGYEGNDYVYNNYQYQKETYDTSIRENMIDTKISTYYEYSRITVQDSAEETNTYFNKDSEFARCTISYEAADVINFINIDTEDLGVNIVGIQTSLDGIKYTSVPLNSKIVLNNKLESYSNYGYVYGSGMLCVPLCKFFKITFETDRNKSDVIAYEKTVFYYPGDEYEDITAGDWYATTQSDNWGVIEPFVSMTFTEDQIVETAKRSAIKLNDVATYKKIYNTSTVIKSDELITAECYSIALFANAYVPNFLDDSCIQFTLTINGLDYEVVPINSNKNGTKVLRFSGGKSNTVYTELLSEKIKSAYLTIVYDNTSDMSPMVNNIKILIGGEI